MVFPLFFFLLNSNSNSNFLFIVNRLNLLVIGLCVYKFTILLSCRANLQGRPACAQQAEARHHQLGCVPRRSTGRTAHSPGGRPASCPRIACFGCEFCLSSAGCRRQQFDVCVRRWSVVRVVGGRFESGLSAIWESQFVSPGHLELRRCGRLGPDFE